MIEDLHVHIQIMKNFETRQNVGINITGRLWMNNLQQFCAIIFFCSCKTKVNLNLFTDLICMLSAARSGCIELGLRLFTWRAARVYPRLALRPAPIFLEKLVICTTLWCNQACILFLKGLH